MASVREGTEAALIVFSLGIFIGYHIWLFGFRGKGYKVQPKYHDFFQAGKLARSIWAEACATDEKDAILGVQQARNAMTACTYLATISVALATAGLTIIFDDNKIQRIRELAVNDAIMRHLPGPPLVPPTVVIAMALGSLYASFVCFAQSVRLYVHTGFYIRACTSRFNPGTLRVAEAKRVTIHAGMAFSVGLRLFYFFIPLVMWSIGVTALLITSILMTAIVAYMDHFDMKWDNELDPEPETRQALNGQHTQQHQQQEQQPSAANASRIELTATAGTAAGAAAAAEFADGSEQQQRQRQQQEDVPPNHTGRHQNFSWGGDLVASMV